MVRAAALLAAPGFSRWYGYLLYRLARRLAVLSGFGLPTPFNRQFRMAAAVSLPGPRSPRVAGDGILTVWSSRAPLGFRLVPGLP